MSQATPCYGHLHSSFFNMSDTERAFMASNFYTLDEGLREYLIFNSLIPKRPSADAVIRPRDVLKASIEYLALKVDAR